mgnify:CR=1 FL=1
MPLWLAPRPLIIASKSSARRALLQAAGVGIEIRPASVDERAIEARAAFSDPGAIAALLAREKARAVAASDTDAIVLGADQTLALGVQQIGRAHV